MKDLEFKISRDIDPECGEKTQIEGEPFPSLMCWSTGPASICLDSWENNRAKIGVYLSGIRITTITLAANECKLIEEGDFIKIKANICLDVNNRCVTAKGYVRVAGQRVNFEGPILQF